MATLRQDPLVRKGMVLLITVCLIYQLLYIFYDSFYSPLRLKPEEPLVWKVGLLVPEHVSSIPDEIQTAGTALEEAGSSLSSDACVVAFPAETDINTVDQFQNFDFKPKWIKTGEFWDSTFEERYKLRRSEWSKMPLKVILVPFSHNDPGWKKTFEDYYECHTRHILKNLINKMQVHKNMTFVWSEISFLARWWERAHSSERHVFLELLEEGRLEVVTGGWVMADEATTHIFALVDQLIEGHQWMKRNLGITPTSGWVVDSFGHGSTVPYLLKSSGFSRGAVIQRIHYAWKQWLAEHQLGDFIWRQDWDRDGHFDILIHHQPFHHYNIKHSCGPQTKTCYKFDFRHIRGEYTGQRAIQIDNNNVEKEARHFLEQFGKTGSLYPHNVVLMPIGDDFRFGRDIEWDQQYINYMKIIEYITENRDLYNAEIRFGTPKDYFQAIEERTSNFKTLKGDFFVYSDVINEGIPAYWSGYFTTRPYWKALDRDLEANLRSAEILYTFALCSARSHGQNNSTLLLSNIYKNIVQARQTLALFQHHDSITGTSNEYVMKKNGLKLYKAIKETVTVQKHSVQTLLAIENPLGKSKSPTFSEFIKSHTDRDSYETLSKLKTIFIKAGEKKKIVVFNSLAQFRQHVVVLHVSNPHVKVVNNHNKTIPYQVNPIWSMTRKPLRSYSKLKIRSASTVEYELMFVVELLPLSLTTYTILYSKGKHPTDFITTTYCQTCRRHKHFHVKPIEKGDIQMENTFMRLLIDGKTGFLKAVTNKSTNMTRRLSISFSAYMSAEFQSGAYLFSPDPYVPYRELDILRYYPGQEIIITSGPVMSELKVIYDTLLVHSLRIYHTPDPLNLGIYIENTIDFGRRTDNLNTEIFMRLVTDFKNGDPPEFYSDLNGFQMQKRVKVKRIGIQGNYFPLTTMAYIQDPKHRLSLLVDHAQGAASWKPGWLEVMLDRRVETDDNRGMGEGVVDNKRTLSKYWIILENVHQSNEHSKPSLLANYLSLGLLYQPNVFVLKTLSNEGFSPIGSLNFRSVVSLLSKPLPCDIHLMNIRTLPDQYLSEYPTYSALFLFHRQGFSCTVGADVSIPKCHVHKGSSVFDNQTIFTDLSIKSLEITSLTGLHKTRKVKSFNSVNVKPMEIVTIRATTK